MLSHASNTLGCLRPRQGHVRIFPVSALFHFLRERPLPPSASAQKRCSRATHCQCGSSCSFRRQSVYFTLLRVDRLKKCKDAALLRQGMLRDSKAASSGDKRCPLTLHSVRQPLLNAVRRSDSHTNRPFPSKNSRTCSSESNKASIFNVLLIASTECTINQRSGLNCTLRRAFYPIE